MAVIGLLVELGNLAIGTIVIWTIIYHLHTISALNVQISLVQNSQPTFTSTTVALNVCSDNFINIVEADIAS